MPGTMGGMDIFYSENTGSGWSKPANCGPAINTKEDELVAPAKVSLLHSIWPYVKDNAQRVDSNRVITHNESFDTENAKPGLQHILRLPAHWQAPVLSDVTLLKEYRGHEFSMSESDNPLNIPEVETTSARLARHTGTVIHNAFQAIVENKLVTNNSCIAADTFINQQHGFWKIQLQQLGWSGDNLNRALQKLTVAVANTLASEQGRWLLNCDHQQSACELSLMQKEKQDVREHIIDRTFMADGVRWIVDYKSSEPESGQTETVFIAKEMETYKGQLQRYEKLMAATEILPIKTALYLVSIGKLVEAV